MSKSSILVELSYIFDGKRQIPAVKSSRFLNLSEGTIRNKIESGTFPFKVLTIKSKNSKDPKHVRHFVALSDLAAHLAHEEAQSALPTGKRSVGRPRKTVVLFQAERNRLQNQPVI